MSKEKQIEEMAKIIGMSDSEYIKERRMPPLEKARLRAKEPPACKDCPESERVGKVLYCKISGKMILPQYENISCCRGERLKGE